VGRELIQFRVVCARPGLCYAFTITNLPSNQLDQNNQTTTQPRKKEERKGEEKRVSKANYEGHNSHIWKLNTTSKRSPNQSTHARPTKTVLPNRPRRK
jgi:hypothetical protein